MHTVEAREIQPAEDGMVGRKAMVLHVLSQKQALENGIRYHRPEVL
jgi:hypothetical protein